MLQELFRIPGLNIPIYGYGLMLVIGFLAAVQLAKFLARHSRLDPELFVNAGLIALLSGVLGARLSHVLENFGEYTNPQLSVWENLRNAVNISSGGLTYYGGFLVAFVALVYYGWRKKVSIRLGMDIVAPCLMIGLGFGRIGCLLNGCCYGAEATVPWAITFPYNSNPYVDQYFEGKLQVPPPLVLAYTPTVKRPLKPSEFADIRWIHGQLMQKDRQTVQAGLLQQGGRWADTRYTEAMLNHAAQYGGMDLSGLAAQQRSLPVHPAQLYSTLTAWLLAALLVAYFTLPHAPGRVFALMLLLEPIGRYLLEMLRVEPPVMSVLGHGLSFSMVLSIPLELLGIVLWVLFGWLDRGHKVAAPAPAQVPSRA